MQQRALLCAAAAALVATGSAQRRQRELGCGWRGKEGDWAGGGWEMRPFVALVGAEDEENGQEAPAANRESALPFWGSALPFLAAALPNIEARGAHPMSSNGHSGTRKTSLRWALGCERGEGRGQTGELVGRVRAGVTEMLWRARGRAWRKGEV
eukprot:218106-Rhodomonas_salina.2